MTELRVQCGCGKGLRLSAEQAGRKGRCPQCGRTMVVPPAEEFERLAGGGRISVGQLETLGANEAAQRDAGAIVASIGERETRSATPGDRRARTGSAGTRSTDGAAALWQPGKVIDDRYEVKQELGSGQFGRVWKVWHNQWQIDLAVKELRTDKHLTENRRKDFLREAQAWVDDIGMHPHVVTAWYVRELERQHYLFLEYCDGGTLHDWIEQGKTRDLKMALDIGIQLCWGLAHCHDKGIVHRDFKPLNVLMTADGTAKLTDFGTVRFAAMAEAEDDGSESENVDDIRRTRGGRLQGTPAYMPPEQWAKGSDIDHRADVYALGVTLFEMLTGEFPIRPSGGRDTAHWARAHGEDTPCPLSEFCPDAPPSLGELIAHCLDKRAESRPETCVAAADRLTEMYEAAVGNVYPRTKPDEAELLADQLNNKALSLLDLGHRERAEATFEQAVSADPHHPEATYNRGLILWRSAKITDAELVRQLEEVRSSHSDDWRDEYLLGLVHLERGDVESAARLLREAAEASSNDPAVVKALAECKTELGQQWRESGVQRVFDGHTDLVSSVAWLPNGRRAISGSWDKTLRLWDTASGRCLRTIEGHSNSVTSVAFSPDGNLALSGSKDHTLLLWEVETGRCLRTFIGHSHEVYSAVFSPDGKQVLSGGADSTLCLWESESGRCLRKFEGHTRAVYSVAFFPDGGRVLSAGSEGAVRMWELSSGNCLSVIQVHADGVHSVALSPDGRQVLSANRDSSVTLWDVATGRRLQSFEGHTFPATSVVFSFDGQLALSGSGDALRLWEVESGRCLRTFEGTAGSVAFSRDGRCAVSGSGAMLRLWDVRTVGRQPLVVSRPVSAVELSGISSAVAQLRACVDSLLHSRSAREAYQLLSDAIAQRGYERSTDMVALRRGIGRFGHVTGVHAGWHSRTLEGHTTAVTSVAFSSDARCALSGGDLANNRLRLWEIESGRSSEICEGYAPVAFSPDGRLVLSQEWSGKLQLCDVETGNRLWTFSGHTSAISCVAFSPDGRSVLSGSNDKTLRLWDVKSGRCIRTFSGHALWVTSLAYSPDGKQVLSASHDKTVRLWDVESGRFLQSFEVEQGVTCVAFSADGRWVLSGSNDKMLRLWEVASRRCIRTFAGHTAGVNCVTLSPDRRHVLSGSHDKTVRLWDVATGGCVRTFEGHNKRVTCVAFSPDGARALSGSEDQTLRLWEFVWNYEFPEPADWDEGARPYLETFLTLRTPFVAELPKDREPTEDEIQAALTRRGKPRVAKEDFQQLMRTLQYAGYGWLRREGVKKKLLEMAANWTGPPPLVPHDEGAANA